MDNGQSQPSDDGTAAPKIAIDFIDGFAMPRFFVDTFLKPLTLEEHLRQVKNMQLRDDDVIVCAHAKCGTNWLWEILHMLVSGSTAMTKKVKETGMLEFTPVDKIDAIASPRIINTHLPIHLLPLALGQNGCKLVHIIRNPKDVAISAYHHYFKLETARGAPSIRTLEEHKNTFIAPDGAPAFVNFYKYTRDFVEYLEDNKRIPSLVLSYEDLSHRPVQLVKSLSEFLGKSHDDQLIADIVDATSFENMKAAESDKEDFPFRRTKDGTSVLFRKGKVGDWKNHFTVTESDMFDAVAERELGNTKIRFQYE